MAATRSRQQDRGSWPGRAHLFIATSLDGYIARPDGDIEWLTQRATQAGDTGYEAFMAGVDTLVMGRNTYEKARRT